jgi:hypothetical protein
MFILSGLLLLGVGLGVIAHTLHRPGRHRAPPDYLKLRPCHARPTPRRLPGNLYPARPHRLVAQDAALSRR